MSVETWNKFHKNKINSNYPTWPIESMVRVLFGDYLINKPNFKKGMNVLDVGCGFGNNLLPFYMKGFNCHGVEISSRILEISKKALSERSIKDIQLTVGSNRNLPYPREYFNLILSNNVIHYENTEENILQGLKEYKRVLKKGGSLFLMTAGPEHLIYKRSKALGGQRYQISNTDFRDGEIYFYFDNEKKLKFYLDKFFKNVETGRVTEKLMKTDLDFLISHSYKG